MNRGTLCAIILIFAGGLAFAQDASELLARGILLIPSKPAEAVKVLEQALRLDPDLPHLRYQLGLAYHSIGDEGDAEAELREAVNAAPDSAEAHNYLGIVLFQEGEAKGALEEFRAAVRLAPKDPNAHFNLAEALARTGESAKGLEELRIAADLKPADTGLARLVKAVETALSPGSTIKVDVRQVLVPAVVTDPKGVPLKGLTQADFRVFEDGVEQRITGFSVESSGSEETGQAARGPDGSHATMSASVSAPVTAAPVKRTYMICIDTLHTSFTNFVSVREALVKLFERERSDDSQYVVVALGGSAEMVVNVTRDPNAVLAVFQSKRMQKIFLDGQQGGLTGEMERFRRDIQQTREACNMVGQDKVYQAQCETGIARANLQSGQIAEVERMLTMGFLREFRALISQLARARDRRTVVLISDGFGIDPGHEAYSLVNAYFPFASHCLVPPTVNCPWSGLSTAVRLTEEFEPILQLAARSNVTIDTIDSRGLYGQKGFEASGHGDASIMGGSVGRAERDADSNRGNTLAEVAAATGGTAFHDSNDLLGGLERAFSDGRDYYTIAYASSNENLDGKFRSITVKVRDRNAAVRAKRGYWAAQ